MDPECRNQAEADQHQSDAAKHGWRIAKYIHPFPSRASAVVAERLSEASEQKALQAEDGQTEPKEHPVEVKGDRANGDGPST